MAVRYAKNGECVTYGEEWGEGEMSERKTEKKKHRLTCY